MPFEVLRRRCSFVSNDTLIKSAMNLEMCLFTFGYDKVSNTVVKLLTNLWFQLVEKQPRQK